MRIIEDPAELSSLSLRRCGFVPTMGALHEGHGSLVRLAAAGGRPVVVSIFVNPTQFGPKEDYARYPRTLDSDCALLEPLGVAAVFVPSVEAIYPRGLEAARVESAALALPDVATMPGLEDSCRPGHLAGVALVVGRLFDLVGASAAYFGEKDFQQLAVVRRMSADLDQPVTVIGCPIVREADGLAMSSRNIYLSSSEREAATVISRALRAGAAMISAGESDPAVIEAHMASIIEAEPLAELDYAVVVDPDTLRTPAELLRGTSVRLLMVAKVGSPRLLDNLGVDVP